MTVTRKAWKERQKYLQAVGAVYGITLGFFVVLSMMFVTLARQVDSPRQLQAATCSIPTTVSTTIELTPDSEDNIIDCSGQNITVTETGRLILKKFHTADSSFSNDGGVVLLVNNITIDAGGEVIADGQGYVSGNTDGGSAGVSTGLSGGSGGGHGGAGGIGNTLGGGGNTVGATGSSFGSRDYPLTLGGAGGTSGTGGVGGAGGGAIKIQASGTVTIDGKLSADGASGVKSGDGQTAGGGGAGGSIWVEAAILAGSGQVSAKGGGTDTTASYFGGGGGGGRVALICTTSTTFPSGNVSVAFGTGSQNGQIGSLVGPGCKPAEPTVLKFYERNATAGRVDREMYVGEITTKTALTFASDLAGENLKLEIEVREKNQQFTNSPTNAQVTALSNKTCTGIPAQNNIIISTYCGFVEVTTGLSTSKEYKWQARVVSSAGIASLWVPFGGNGVEDTDFTIAGAAAAIIAVEGNNVSTTVGQPVTPKPKARVIDAAGYGVPFYGLNSWTVLTGGGSVINGQLTADKWGEVTADWTVGTVAGVNNNTLRVQRNSPAMNVVFTVSAVPGDIHSYKVLSSTSISLINSPFTYTVTAQDLYGNIIPFTHNLAVVPVSSHDIETPGLGTLAPEEILFSGSHPTAPWLSLGWDYRKKITFSNTVENLGVDAVTMNDFPVLISLTSSNFDFSKARENGQDIRVTAADGVTQLSFEIERWDAVAQSAQLWVKVPQVTAESANGAVYVYYGNEAAQSAQNSAGTWNSNYRLVKHLNDSSGTTTKDSTSNAFNGTKVSATEPNATTGKIGEGQTFDGTNDFINIPHHANLSFGTADAQFTLEAWVKTTAQNGEIIAKTRPSSTTHMEYRLHMVNGKPAFYRYSNTNPVVADEFVGQATINDGNWHHVVFVNEGASSHKLYVNGVLDTTNTTTWTRNNTATQALNIGRHRNNTFGETYLNGQLDEVRISNVARSAAWVAATYKSQNNQFATVGEEEGQTETTRIYADPESGVVTIQNGSYTYTESIKIKVSDENGRVGYSNSILFVTATGSCPAIVIDINQTWRAIDVPGGVFDCRGLGPMKVDPNVTWTLTSYDNGDSNWSNDYGVTILSDSLNVQSTATITATAQGFQPSSRGPGGVGGGPGSSHGGYGGGSSPAPYGNLYEPITFGSSGRSRIYGPGGAGGGAVKFVTTGNLVVNGKIEANGGNGEGGGSGGSIWLDIGNQISGSGVIEANGGNSVSDLATPSGGRIAVYYESNDGFSFTPEKIRAFGGVNGWTATSVYGGAGTVYFENRGTDQTQSGVLMVDNRNNNVQSAGVTAGNYQLKEIRVTRHGHVEFMGDGSTLTISSAEGLQGDNTKPIIKVSGTLSYSGGGTLQVDGVDLGINGRALGISDVQIGGTYAAGMSFYGQTWYHNPNNPYELGNVLVKNNGTVTMNSYQNADTVWTNDYGPSVHFENLEVESGGVITATGFGYPRGLGAGHSFTYNGGAHGGYGADAFGAGLSALPNGSVYEPVSLGSSGSSNGGGAMKIVVAGTFTHNGKIETNGIVGSQINLTQQGGGGAGGSIYVQAGVLNGSGVMEANGGNGAGINQGGGGSGGRIAVYMGSGNFPVGNPTNMHAYGGTHNQAGGPGTVYVENTTTDMERAGRLFVDNRGNNTKYAGVPAGDYSFAEIQTTAYGHVEFLGDASILTITSGAGMQGDNTKPVIKVSGTLSYTGGTTLQVDGVDLGINGRALGLTDVQIGGTNAAGMSFYGQTWWHNQNVPYELGDVIVKSNGTMTMNPHDNGDTDWNNDYGPKVQFTNLEVESGGLITATGFGYQVGQGAGFSFNYNGGSYGGYGADAFGEGKAALPYGSVYEPTHLGSSGSNRGGGALSLFVSGTFTHNGKIEANGLVGGQINLTQQGGGGAGGSIYVRAGTLNGTGVMEANGGNGAGINQGGGGSGGRIAVYMGGGNYPVTNPTNIHAYGGTHNQAGGPGTIYVENTSSDAALGGMLLVDNRNNNTMSAGVPTGEYSFTQIKTTRYGHVEFLGDDSVLTITSGAGLNGDNTKPVIKVSGTLAYTGEEVLHIDGVDLGLNGKAEGLQDIQIGGSNAAGMSFYGQTWWYNQERQYELRNVVVKNNGTVTMNSYNNGDNNWANDFGPTVQFENLEVENGGVITATGQGYPVGQGAGFSYNYNGGAYGGYGADAFGEGKSAVPHGSVYEPSSLGSPGSNVGGGALTLIVSGTFTHNGKIETNGLAGVQINLTQSGGGGSGGSIYVRAGTLNGTGIMEANGGNGAGINHGGGGSGGRIAVYMGGGNFPVTNPSNVHAYGGTHNQVGGPGTVYVENTATDEEQGGMLLVDNRGNNSMSAGLPQDQYQFKQIRATGYGHLEVIGENSVLTITSGAGMTGDNTKPVLKVSGVLSYTAGELLYIDGVDLGINGRAIGLADIEIGGTNAGGLTLYGKTWWYDDTVSYQFANVTVKSNGTITMNSYNNGDGNWNNDYGPTAQFQNLTIENGGVITATGTGYATEQGHGYSIRAKGGSYGGYGAGYGSGDPAPGYGSFFEPKHLGSGGSNSGGGAMSLLVSEVFTNNGKVEANGLNGVQIGLIDHGGGGSGGSIYVETSILNGTGIFEANGGNGSGINQGGGGGGGRIALYMTEGNFPAESATNAHAYGGTVNTSGGPGTVYVAVVSENPHNQGSLYIRNDDRAGRSATIPAGMYLLNTVHIGKNVTVWTATNPSESYYDYAGNLVQGRGVLFDLKGNFTLEEGAFILGIGAGFGSDQGPGKGSVGTGYSGGGGGANGGDGGAGQSDGANIPAAGGLKFGDQLQPLTLGAGGGTSGAGAQGGAGGGAFGVIARGYLNDDDEFVEGNVVIAGNINMSGAEGKVSSPGGGGGAGGSILVHGNTCTISGNLLAQGGAGGNSDIDGGSGGGGRVSILYNIGPCEVTGTVSVQEGVPADMLNYGAQVGQVGTFPPEPNSVPWPSLYREQFELREVGSSIPGGPLPRFASAERMAQGDVQNVVESVIPVGGVINGTTVTLKADAYDAGARSFSPKRLKIQVELKKTNQSFTGTTNIYESNTVNFTGGPPVVLSVTASNLEMGASYKWRVRTLNVDTGLASEWQDYGGNGANDADFTITTVATLELSLDKTSMELTDTVSLTVTAKNTFGEVDTSYRGTVTFSSSSSLAILPENYTFTSEDSGVKSFPEAGKFFESGTFSITVADVVNPVLIDSKNITIISPTTPFITLSASSTSVSLGQSVTLYWQSGQLNNLVLNNGIGSVATAGLRQVTPPIGETTYTISGQLEGGGTLTASVVVTVSSQVAPPPTVSEVFFPSGVVTPSVTRFVRPRPTTVDLSCPIIESFIISNRIIKRGEPISLSWKVSNADRVSIDALSGSLPLAGAASLLPTESYDITLFASKDGCKRTQVRRVEVVNTYPWEGAGALLIGLIALETVALQIGAAQGNLWFALLGFIDRRKRRKPWGVVYDAVTKKLLSRVVVRLWDAQKGTLVDTVVTDANGIFKLTPKVGKYVLKVSLSGYSFPSKLVKGKEDTGYSQVYTGEVIEIKSEEDVIMVSIPLDPLKKAGSVSTRQKVIAAIESFVAILSPVMLFAGFLYSVVVTVMYPVTFNFVIVGLYGVTFVAKALVYLAQPKIFGQVLTLEGKIVSGLEIGLYDKEFKNLVARTFTNKNGKYNFVVANQPYTLQVMDSGYKILGKHISSEGLVIPKDTRKSSVRIIAESLTVYPVQKLEKLKK